MKSNSSKEITLLSELTARAVTDLSLIETPLRLMSLSPPPTLTQVCERLISEHLHELDTSAYLSLKALSTGLKGIARFELTPLSRPKLRRTPQERTHLLRQLITLSTEVGLLSMVHQPSDVELALCCESLQALSVEVLDALSVEEGPELRALEQSELLSALVELSDQLGQLLLRDPARCCQSLCSLSDEALKGLLKPVELPLETLTALLGAMTPHTKVMSVTASSVQTLDAALLISVPLLTPQELVKMSLCPPGEVLVNQEVPESPQRPHRRVHITRPFLVSQRPITREVWQLVMDGELQRGAQLRERQGRVTWYEVVRFCNRLSLLEGLTPCYMINDSNSLVLFNISASGYRMLTEAEWRYVIHLMSEGSEGLIEAGHWSWCNDTLFGRLKPSSEEPDLDPSFCEASSKYTLEKSVVRFDESEGRVSTPRVHPSRRDSSTRRYGERDGEETSSFYVHVMRRLTP